MSGVIHYLIEERDNIVGEKSRLRGEAARILDDSIDLSSSHSRPNLMKNPNKLDRSMIEAKPISRCV